MSAPIHNIRDGVIPAVAPAQVTEAHELLFDKIAHGGISKAQALQLIADSEAAAMEKERAT